MSESRTLIVRTLVRVVVVITVAILTLIVIEVIIVERVKEETVVIIILVGLYSSSNYISNPSNRFKHSSNSGKSNISNNTISR